MTLTDLKRAIERLEQEERELIFLRYVNEVPWEILGRSWDFPVSQCIGD